MRTIRVASRWAAAIALVSFSVPPQNAIAARAPDWMRAQVDAPVPEHDEETDAVVLYSETVLTVQAPGKMKRLDRMVYRILRRDGGAYGTVSASYGSDSQVTSIRGWSIPPEGKDFETRSRDIVETGLTDIDGGELITDLRRKSLRIPAAIPGSVIGYEIERELEPYDMSDEWDFQDTIPVREARYTVRLPPGWSYKVFWLNDAGREPVQVSDVETRWAVSDLKPVRLENNMPPWRGIAARMVLSLQPPDSAMGGFQSWGALGDWYLDLTRDRRDASEEIRRKVHELADASPEVLDKMRALTRFVQSDIRYVAIELGVGGLQPHAATEVFEHRYGDCKDKVTLLSSMLKEIGIESHYVIINTDRGSVTTGTPPNLGFNHAIIAIELPAEVDASTLPAALVRAERKPMLFFDPTSPLVPLGALPGPLQANVGLLVEPGGSALVKLPQLANELNGVEREAHFTLDEKGMLSGDVKETWSGDAAAAQRYGLRTARLDTDQIKPIESMLTHSLSTFTLLKATVGNLPLVDKPLVWRYSLEVDRFARTAGDLLLLRPRVLGSLSSALMETKKPRVHPIEFNAPMRSSDVFEITLPAGYAVEELPQPIDEDLGFVAYRSKTTVEGNVLRYTRTAEIKQLSVPVSEADALKRFFRIIESDERASAVLAKVAPGP